MWTLRRIYLLHGVLIIVSGIAILLVGVLVTRTFDHADIFHYTDRDLLCYVYLICLIGVVTIFVGILGILGVSVSKRRSKSILIVTLSFLLITFILQSTVTGVAILIRRQNVEVMLEFEKRYLENVIDLDLTVMAGDTSARTQPPTTAPAAFPISRAPAPVSSAAPAAPTGNSPQAASTRLIFVLRRDIYHRRHWCCGWDGPNDLCKSSRAPTSCCRDRNLINGTICMCENAYRSGCKQPFQNALNIYAYFVGGVNAVAAIITIFGIIWNFLLVLKRKSSSREPLEALEGIEFLHRLRREPETSRL